MLNLTTYIYIHTCVCFCVSTSRDTNVDSPACLRILPLPFLQSPWRMALSTEYLPRPSSQAHPHPAFSQLSRCSRRPFSEFHPMNYISFSQAERQAHLSNRLIRNFLPYFGLAQDARCSSQTPFGPLWHDSGLGWLWLTTENAHCSKKDGFPGSTTESQQRRHRRDSSETSHDRKNSPQGNILAWGVL